MKKTPAIAVFLLIFKEDQLRAKKNPALFQE